MDPMGLVKASFQNESDPFTKSIEVDPTNSGPKMALRRILLRMYSGWLMKTNVGIFL